MSIRAHLRGHTLASKVRVSGSPRLCKSDLYSIVVKPVPTGIGSGLKILAAIAKMVITFKNKKTPFRG